MNLPLVLISGLLSNEKLWKHQVESLRDRVPAIHVISPAQNTAEKMVEEILAVAPAKFALAGHSMGGWLCLEVMWRAPEKVQKLCLLNTTARDDSPEKRETRQQMIARANEGHFSDIVEQIATKFVFNLEVKQSVVQMFLEVGRETFINQQMAMLGRQECMSLLSKIDCPTLVIHAVEDRNFSLSEHEELVACIPKAELALVQKSGHMSPLENPEGVASLLKQWLLTGNL